MPLPNQTEMPNFQQDINSDLLRRAFQGKLAAADRTAEEMQRDFRKEAAATLLAAGISLIPSEHLMDNQFVVSNGVYREAKKLCNF